MSDLLAVQIQQMVKNYNTPVVTPEMSSARYSGKCIACNVWVPSGDENLGQHLAGARHIKNVSSIVNHYMSQQLHAAQQPAFTPQPPQDPRQYHHYGTTNHDYYAGTPLIRPPFTRPARAAQSSYLSVARVAQSQTGQQPRRSEQQQAQIQLQPAQIKPPGEYNIFSNQSWSGVLKPV